MENYIDNLPSHELFALLKYRCGFQLTRENAERLFELASDLRAAVLREAKKAA